MNIASLLKLLVLSSVLTLTACGGGTDDGGDSGTDGGGDGGTGTTVTDSDSDGVADENDAFPNDASETVDSDNDGTGDNADVFDNDPNEQFDSDNDGTGDNADMFDDDPNEQFDDDNDGVGNNSDCAPNDANFTDNCEGDGTGGDGEATVLTFNLTGAVSVVTTENTATQVDEGDGSNIPGRVAVLEDGRKLNTFVFHESSGKKSLTKKDKYKNLLAAGLSPDYAAKESEESSSNFFIIDEDGNLSFAAESDYDIKVSYSVVWEETTVIPRDPDDSFSEDETVITNWLFFALDSEEPWNYQEFISATNGCAIFKVNIDSDPVEWSCVEEGYIAASINDDYRKTLSDQKLKPLQIDDEGNVFFIAKELQPVDDDGDGIAEWYDFNNDYWESQSLRKVDIEGVGQDLTPDNFSVNSFMALPNDTITYTAQDILSNWTTQLNMVKNASSDTPESFVLEDALPWGDFFYAKDNANTIIYSDSQSWGAGINFIQPRTIGPGRYNLELDTSIFSDNDWNVSPKRIVIADDGAMYGLFVEERYLDDTTTFTGKVKKMLPYSGATFAEFKIGNDWDDYWQFFDNGQRDVQIAKGYIYYIEERQHPDFGSRSVIRAVRLVDGERVDILEDSDWLQRYDIYNWKLSDDRLIFTGFDKNTSTSVTGRLDTVALKQGLGEDEFLEVIQTASVLSASGKIEDLEVLRGEASDEFAGGTPKVSTYYTDQENFTSASVEFTKYMNTESVNAGIKVYEIGEDESGTETQTEIDLALKIWLNTSLHMIFDTDRTSTDSDGNINVSTDPLSPATTYRIEIDGESLDADGFELLAGSSVLEWEWSTRPTSGWYNAFTGAVTGITDGNVGKFAVDDNHYNTIEKPLATIGYPLNVKVTYAMPSSTSSRNTLTLVDSHMVDWSTVEGAPTDDSDNQWEWQDGFEVLRDGTGSVSSNWSENSDWYDAWRQDKELKTYTPIISENIDDGDDTNDAYYLDPGVDNANQVTYLRIPSHHLHESGDIYSDIYVTSNDGEWNHFRKNIGMDPTNPDTEGTLYENAPDYYEDQVTSVRFTWRDVDGIWDWYDDDDNLIDWSNTYDYVGWGWEDDSGNRLSDNEFEWRGDYWVDAETGDIPDDISLYDTVWQGSYYASDIDMDGMINLYGLCRFDGPVDEFDSCTYNSVSTAEAGENYSFNQDSDWEWSHIYTADNFIESTDSYRWFGLAAHGGWCNGCSSDQMEMYSLMENTEWFEHDWNNDIRIDGGWSAQQWVTYEFTIITDEMGDDDVSNDATTMTLNVIGPNENILQTLSKELFININEASWKAFDGEDGRESEGFRLDLKFEGGDIVIDNIIVTDMSGDEEEVLVEETFDSTGNIFTIQSSTTSDAEAASISNKIRKM